MPRRSRRLQQSDYEWSRCHLPPMAKRARCASPEPIRPGKGSPATRYMTSSKSPGKWIALVHHALEGAIRIAGSESCVISPGLLGRITGIHVSLCQQKSTSHPYALWRARCASDQDRLLRTYASRPMVPALCRTGHPFAASGSAEPSQKIEFGFSASPETIRREPRESPPSPSR